MGMGPGHIPASKIRAYARDELELTGDDDVDGFLSLIRRMDDEYLVASAPKKLGGKNEPDPDKQIPADDVEGVRSMFRKMQHTSKPKPGKGRTP